MMLRLWLLPALVLTLLAAACGGGNDDDDSDADGDADSDGDGDGDGDADGDGDGDTDGDGDGDGDADGDGDGDGDADGDGDGDADGDGDGDGDCDLSEPAECNEGELDAVPGDAEVGTFFDDIGFCYATADPCAAAQIAEWAPAFDCTGDDAGRAQCGNAEQACVYRISGALTEGDLDALCDLTTLDAIDAIFLTTYLD